ncbi:MAG: hypothetical protein EOP45_00520 [Sphingobacteriaceae bacterium]|nr:MAG: hypothetical protein EOP45_00520 [Sphingobacteriaceae bacterium]
MDLGDKLFSGYNPGKGVMPRLGLLGVGTGLSAGMALWMYNLVSRKNTGSVTISGQMKMPNVTVTSSAGHTVEVS